jgi:ABC-type sulfate transport system permease subunit
VASLLAFLALVTLAVKTFVEAQFQQQLAADKKSAAKEGA